MTREHYEKYARLSECVPDEVTSDLFENVGIVKNEYDPTSLTNLYSMDEHLNNIPLSRFDVKFPIVRRLVCEAKMTPHGGLSLANNVCILKHILIFRILGVDTPPYEDNN